MKTIIDGRFRVVEKLGEGFSGEVFRVRDDSGEFALKLLKPIDDRRFEDDVVRSFKFEFGFLKDLRHPNVVAIHDFGFDEELKRFYFTEDFLKAKTVRDYAKKAGLDVIEDLFLQAIGGLQAIHKAGILHGDLKAGNILVVDAPAPLLKIIDLGLADPRFPFAAGTPATMAPEKILKEAVDERSDLYSLGVVFYELFAGENPFLRDDVPKTYQAHLSVLAPKITLKNPKVPTFWNAVFETLLAKNPNHRYRTAAKLLEDIDFLRPRQSQKMAIARSWQPDRWIGRRPLLESLLKAVDQTYAQPGRPILLVGESGSGRSRLLQDLKYELQLRGIRFEGSIRSLLPEEEGTVVRELRTAGREPIVVRIPPLSPKDLRDFLSQMSGLTDIPDAFVQNLWEKTRGNIGLLLSVLEGLASQNRLIDAQGRWNLAVFREGAFIDALPLQGAGTPELDELLHALPPEDLPSRLHLRARILEKEGLRLIREGQYQEARNRLERALALLEESTVADEVLSIHIQNFIAWLLCQEGKADEAIALFEKQREHWERLKPEDQRRIVNNDLGYAYLLKGDVKKAVAALEKAQTFYEKSGDAATRIKGLYNLAEAWVEAKDYRRAIGFYEKCAKEARLERNFELLLRAYNGLGKTHHLQQRWNEAMDSYGKGLELARYLKDYSAAAALAQNIGSIESERGSFEEAKEHLNLALKMLGQVTPKNVHARYLEGRALLELGDLLRKQKKFEDAEGYVRDARRLAFDEDALASFRFWVVLTQAQIEKDRGNKDRLRDLMADLLPLADDDDKKKRCRELMPSEDAPAEYRRDQATTRGLEQTKSRLEEEISEAKDRLDTIRREIVESTIARRFAGQRLITQNKAMLELFRLVERVSDTDLAVLLQGESGTGKELIARSLHENSRRAGKPFVAVNCAALPANLIESELFGYKAGAFTGATRDKKGLMEEANGGTLFLDEIGDLELVLQAKLLRVLQEKIITRLGDTRPIPVDFRLVTATHKAVRDEVAANRFRQDLYYRVCEIEIALPPLRDRKEDIVLLAREFLKRAMKDGGPSSKDQSPKSKVEIGRDLMKVLVDYEWPGNVRELESAIRVAAAMKSGPVIRLKDLPESLLTRLQSPSPPSPSPNLGEGAKRSGGGEGKTWKDIETLAIAKALLRSGFDAKKAAAALGCAASTVYQRLRESKIKEKASEFEKKSWNFPGDAKLDEIKKMAFARALESAGESPYEAARNLGVSPATVYKWMR